MIDPEAAKGRGKKDAALKRDVASPLTQIADARAVRRMGELLKQFDAQGRRTDQPLKDGTVQKLSQAEVAQLAGISERQQKTAIRVANVPAATAIARCAALIPPANQLSTLVRLLSLVDEDLECQPRCLAPWPI